MESSTLNHIASTLVFATVGSLSRSFLYAFNHTQVYGLDPFLDLLDARACSADRRRGLLTVSNHVSVLDDPLIWGVLPYRYMVHPDNMRWSLASHDICFRNRVFNVFFSLGNTLPTHRIAHSPHGGLFQPTMTQVIRLLSDPHRKVPNSKCEISDPFSSNHLTYSTTGFDSFPAPSAYPSRRFSWVHVFPEGMTYQHPESFMRYFKWGIARLILEAEPCPDVLPMWIDGPQHVMSNTRTFPRAVPRPGNDISIRFGNLIDRETVLEPFRRRWLELKARQCKGLNELGVLEDTTLRYGKEAEQLRIDVAVAIRNEVLKVRRAAGLPEEGPGRDLAERYRGKNNEDDGDVTQP
ncbi:hypothetical protein K470DRAFT_253562 [Piedraia hortae CBS 480.64]|uniref:Tafazzin family protein n=1 Tax=Piedraia hortae CBS 480.64 TaxID=1314780 RepID=A0A6A7BQ77_9PEZI|nr:hypothetical protein K470DRAFT_253562 [Piedraia hortae CBS 480.64]